MEFTSRYTVEEWRTGEIEIHDIPDSVLALPLESVLKKAIDEVGSIDMNPVELVFSCVFLQNGWRVVRPPMNQQSPVDQHLSVGIERVTGVPDDALYGTGVPDFFLWNSAGEHQFVEVKASEDSLNENQREWAEANDWNFVIVQLAPASEDLTDEGIMKINKIT